MNIRLSVVVPGYNTSEAWWKRCVDSVLRAIGPNDEIILVDDGSRDGLKVSEFVSLKGLDSRIRIVTKQNGGLSDARNAALRIARGEYVTFVDSDDEVLPEVYEATINRMAVTGSDVGIFEVKTIWPDDGLAKNDVFSRCGVEISGSALTVKQVCDLSRGCLMNYAWNKVYRWKFLDENSLLFDVDGMPCEDIIFNLECVMARARWCTVPILGYVYYRTRGTLLSRYKRTGYAGICRGVEAWRRFRATNGENLGRDLQLWLNARCELTDDELAMMEWKNIWMPGSPYSLVGKWRWLKKHQALGGVAFFLNMAIIVFLRRHFYCRPVRRWNVRRLYPSAVEWRAK